MPIPIINVSILNGSNGFRLDGELGFEFGHSGTSVSSAGDINGDGFDDVMIGSSYAYPGSIPEGYTYIVFGRASGFSGVENLASLNGDNGFRLMDKSTASPFLVSDVGDMNGDGFDDVIIGAPGFYDYYDNPRDHSGAGYVVFGKASGFATDIELSDLNGSDGFKLDIGEGQSVSVSSAGDVNGDGFDDVIVGANSSGYVVFGKATHFAAELDLSSLDGSNGFRFDGVSVHGESVSSAGDVNDDGYADLIVSGGGYGSIAAIFFGQASGFAATIDLSSLDGSNGFYLDGLGNGFSSRSVSYAGDVNGDGLDDVIVSAGAESFVVFGRASGFSAAMNLSSLNGNNGFRLDGAEAVISVSSAGDVNDDGFADVIIGAPQNRNHNGDQVGVSYVVFGKASGFDAVLNLFGLDGEDGFRLEGMNGGNSFGSSVSSAGDVNKDGVNDLIIGAPGVGWNGASYVIFGGSFINEAVYRGTSGDDSLIGTILAERFEGGDGDDYLNGWGGADIFQGDAGDDTIAVVDLDFQRVSGGPGDDKLKLAGNGLDLSLTDFHDRLDGLEIIDMTGSGSNTLTLTLVDLLSLSDTAHTFTVDGDKGDRVIGLMEDWKIGDIEDNYRIFTNGDTVLRVNTAVITDNRIGVMNLADLNGDNGFRLSGTDRLDQFGRSLSEAGDINGDGFDDVIIGAPFAASLDGIVSGASYVILGRAGGFDASLDLSDLDGSNGFRLDGITMLGHSGHSVSMAGDVNGDGFDDMIIGAPFADSDGHSSGSSYVVFGKATGFDAMMDLSSLDGNNGFRVDGEVAGDRAGYSVGRAGDFNGDGYDDVIIASPSADPNGDYSGSSYVIFGKASGFSATLNLSGLTGDNGFRVDGKDSEQSGISVNNAGDVNGDGYDDMIVGTFSDSSYVIFGKASGFNATLDLSSIDGSNGFRLDGGNVFSFAYSGKSVSTAGDINGDGFDDVIVGSYRADANGSFSGVSYVVFGKASGFNATLDLSQLNGRNGFRIDGAASRDYLGISVSNAGDVNGDGFDDVIIGAYGADPIGFGSDAGSSYVIFGKASGFDARMDLSSLTGNVGIRLDGGEGGDQSGESVSGAGDVNGDGFDDLLIGAPYDDTNGIGSGSGFVIFGSRDFGSGGGGELPEIKGTEGADTLKGSEVAEHFIAGDGNDHLLGRGGADVFDAGAGDDAIRIGDLTFASVAGGEGSDALHLAGSGMNLDFSVLDDQIHDIETICLYGRGDNALTLTADSLLNLSDSTNTLKVHGNSGDHVVVRDDGWVDGGSRGFYHTYTHDDAVLLVGANVAVEFV